MNLPIYEAPVYTLRDNSQFWYEGSYPAGGTGVENVKTYTGTFRGNTLVDVSPRAVSGVIPRFRRLNFKNFDPASPTPLRSVTRWPLADE